jgi:hypothetical protein
VVPEAASSPSACDFLTLDFAGRYHVLHSGSKFSIFVESFSIHPRDVRAYWDGKVCSEDNEVDGAQSNKGNNSNSTKHAKLQIRTPHLVLRTAGLVVDAQKRRPCTINANRDKQLHDELVPPLRRSDSEAYAAMRTAWRPRLPAFSAP